MRFQSPYASPSTKTAFAEQKIEGGISPSNFVESCLRSSGVTLADRQHSTGLAAGTSVRSSAVVPSGEKPPRGQREYW